VAVAHPALGDATAQERLLFAQHGLGESVDMLVALLRQRAADEASCTLEVFAPVATLGGETTGAANPRPAIGLAMQVH
jgi:hypothetical protein